MSKIRKQAAPVFTILAAICIASLFAGSCNNPPPPPPPPGNTDTVLIPNLKDTSALSKIDHSIPKSEIMTFRKAFNAEREILAKNNPELFITASEGFNKTQLLDLLKDPKCVGIRIYYGVTKGDTKQELRMILVGTDSQGKDLYIYKTSNKAASRLTQDETGLEYGQCCHEQAVE
ncbi:MAG: hypothetical protein ABIR15_13245 [Chitinophagaceae bacterium]